MVLIIGPRNYLLQLLFSPLVAEYVLVEKGVEQELLEAFRAAWSASRVFG